MAFESIDSLASRLKELGASRIFFKLLSENDNSKQQIYFGGSFNVLQVIPHGEIRSDPGVKRKNYKAPVNLSWIDSDGRIEKATNAQLILYPDYPEVRLSGFLRGCSIAPAELMQSLPRRQGRVLFLGISTSGSMHAYAADAGSPIASEAYQYEAANSNCKVATVFNEVRIVDGAKDSRRDLLERLWRLHREGWISGVRLNASGEEGPCNSRNCGGYTLEASFGIIPNGRSEPDFRGWELKAHTKGGRVTLMTPEPTLGHYRQFGVESFVRKYGHEREGGDIYFTGQHSVGVQNATTRMTLILDGYDRVSQPRGAVDGALNLYGPQGELAAGWSFADLLAHWSRKHSNAVYVPYESREAGGREYRYGRLVTLGVGASFEKYLEALSSGVVKYDPGPKVEVGPLGRTRTKARSQFRATFSQLPKLYDSVTEVLLPIDRDT